MLAYERDEVTNFLCAKVEYGGTSDLLWYSLFRFLALLVDDNGPNDPSKLLLVFVVCFVDYIFKVLDWIYPGEVPDMSCGL